MKLTMSLIALSGAVMLFAVPVAATSPTAQVGVTSEAASPTAKKLLSKPLKKPLGFKGAGGSSKIRENCVYGNDGITRCDDCNVNWDATPPEKICLTAALCYDNNGQRIDCP